MTYCPSLIETLRQRGHRVTPQREMILEAVAQGGQHMTAEEIFAIIKTRTQAIHMATIYRTLDFLVKEGLASRTDMGNGQVIYTTTHHGPHVHLVCRQCNHVTEADHSLVMLLRERCQEQYGFAADLHHVAIFGLCHACQSQQSD